MLPPTENPPNYTKNVPHSSSNIFNTAQVITFHLKTNLLIKKFHHFTMLSMSSMYYNKFPLIFLPSTPRNFHKHNNFTTVSNVAFFTSCTLLVLYKKFAIQSKVNHTHHTFKILTLIYCGKLYQSIWNISSTSYHFYQN